MKTEFFSQTQDVQHHWSRSWVSDLSLTYYYHKQFGVDEDGGSGEDYLKVDSAWHGDIDSDADSVDSEEEDFLKWVYMIQHC